MAGCARHRVFYDYVLGPTRRFGESTQSVSAKNTGAAAVYSGKIGPSLSLGLARACSDPLTKDRGKGGIAGFAKLSVELDIRAVVSRALCCGIRDCMCSSGAGM